MQTTDTLLPLHIGNLLRQYIDENRVKQNGLSRFIGRNARYVSKIFVKETMQTTDLWQICHGLKHNFFDDIARMLPADFTVNNTLETDKDLEIAALKEALQKLEIERDVLQRLLGK